MSDAVTNTDALPAHKQRPIDWNALEDALRELENGLSVLYGLADSSLEGTSLDADQMGKALYFVANNFSRELKAATMAVGLK